MNGRELRKTLRCVLADLDELSNTPLWSEAKTFKNAVERFVRVSKRLANRAPEEIFRAGTTKMVSVTLKELEFSHPGSFWSDYDAVLRHAAKFGLEPCYKEQARDIFEANKDGLRVGISYYFMTTTLVVTPLDDRPGERRQLYWMHRGNSGSSFGLASGSVGPLLFVDSLKREDDEA